MGFTRFIPYTGIDLVNIPRFKNSIAKYGKTDASNKFLSRIFTDKELTYHKKRKSDAKTLAGRFAAKEAVIKAFSRLVKLSDLKEIEILGDIPFAEIASSKLSSLKTNYEVNISITHDTDYAAASAVLLVQ